MDVVGGGQINGPVRDQHAPEGARRVAGQGVGVGLGQGLAGRASTGVVVLQDGKRRRVVLEFLHQLHRGVHVQEVVVGQRFSVQGLEQSVQVAEVLASLVRVFSVAKGAALGHAQVQGVHAALVEARPAEVGVDHGVVVRAHTEPAGREGLAFFQAGHAVALQDVDQRAVVVHGRHHHHVVEVLGRAADEGDASDVNFLDDVGLGGATRDGRFEGVEVHDDEVEVGQVVLRHLGLVAFVVAAVQNPPKHLRVQGLDAPSQDGRIIRHRFHRHHLGAHRLNGGLRASGGVDRDAQAFQFGHNGFQTVFVEDRDEGRFDVAGV